MIIRLETELGERGEERSVAIKMFPQELDILNLGLGIILRDRETAAAAAARGRESEEYIMSTFYEIAEQIMKESSSAPSVVVEDEEEDDHRDELRRRGEERHRDRENGIIRVEFDEFAGVEAIVMPTERENEILLEQELKRGKGFDKIVQTWMQQPEIRNRIRLVPPGCA